MSKLYFSRFDEGRCHPLWNIIDEANNCGFDEIEIIEAKRITGEGFFYCIKYQAMGEAEGEACGKECPHYSPRNGKNGRCRHSGYCYEPTDKKRIIKITYNDTVRKGK